MSTQTTTPASTLGLSTGTYAIDPVHSTVGFTVRHMMVSKVRGQFPDFAGTITVADTIEQSSVNVVIQVASVTTNNEKRDAHLRSGDFFEVEKNPTATFSSTSVRADGGDWIVAGDLTINGITRQVELKTEFGGVHGAKAGFEASTTINRKDFGLTIEMPMDGGGVVIGDVITINLEIEATLQD